MEERRLGWIISYNSTRYLEHGDRGSRLLGNGPLNVNRKTGEVSFLGTYAPREEILADFERRLEDDGTTDLGPYEPLDDHLIEFESDSASLEASPLDTVFARRTYRGLHRGMTTDHVVALLGPAPREMPPNSDARGVLAYDGVQVFTKDGVVGHFTIRLHELGVHVSAAQVVAVAGAHGLTFRRSVPWSSKHVDYLVADGLDVVVGERGVDYIAVGSTVDRTVFEPLEPFEPD